ncbi:hypothetical protein [Candidatus Venteria ishoeyi]|uniref:hypothetical protein n=1 Tax=Candidatus Venteria ishoeyi TaxID=1899563 RepID=UPI0011B0805C|nr:hypothetical protein [Candidatus Venteria ishoeyi]
MNKNPAPSFCIYFILTPKPPPPTLHRNCWYYCSYSRREAAGSACPEFILPQTRIGRKVFYTIVFDLNYAGVLMIFLVFQVNNFQRHGG